MKKHEFQKRRSIEEFVNNLPCPKCRQLKLIASWSPCKDPTCCGIEDSISCEAWKCPLYLELPSLFYMTQEKIKESLTNAV